MTKFKSYIYICLHTIGIQHGYVIRSGRRPEGSQRPPVFLLSSTNNPVQIMAWSSVQCQTNAVLLSTWPSGINFSDILITIQPFSLKKMHLKMSSAKCWPFWFHLHVSGPWVSCERPWLHEGYLGWLRPQPLQWRHNGGDGALNHQPYSCLLNGLFRRRSKKISKLRVTGLCAGNSTGNNEFPAQMTNNTESVSIWWRHHGSVCQVTCPIGFHTCHYCVICLTLLFVHHVCKLWRWSFKQIRSP